MTEIAQSHYLIVGGQHYQPVAPPIHQHVDEFSRLHAQAIDYALRANIGRASSYVRRRQWTDEEIDIRDADGAVLATVGVSWKGFVAHFWIRQLAEPSFIFA
jgi:hypothetical protein